MNLSKLIQADPRVDSGRIVIDVAKHFLDVIEVTSGFQHVGGAGVPKQVARPGFPNVRCVDVPLDQGTEKSGFKRLAPIGQEQMSRIGFDGE